MTDNRQTDYALLLKRSLVAIEELEERLGAAKRAHAEPIAVVGMACRFPGGADSPEAFWNLLNGGVDAVTEIPKERWDVEAIFDPDPDAVGKTYTRWGAFLDGVSLFDADLFGVSPREAVSLDPQQRLLLEVTWEAFERAGIASSSVMGSATAAYVGISTQDYAQLSAAALGPNNGSAYSASGTASSMASGRLAYVFDLKGPNASVDTACSSSHTAVHLAVQALRGREANIALAAGVSLTLHPLGSILTARARMMSFTGRCRTFDAAADGYVRGEGCGVLVLKRLSDAQRDGNCILAVIRGTALSQDGRSSGLTAPNGRAQEAVLRAALDNANLRPDDISYVEAHGTGTSLGDPIEMKALAEVFAGRPADFPLSVGAVKTNIGHTEAAAGIAGIIKTILALQHCTIPPHLHFRNPNPLIPWDRFPVKVPTKSMQWEARTGAPRRAGVSSFGFSGTNGHIILEEAPTPPQRSESATTGAAELVVLSAQTPQALLALAEKFASHLRRADAAPLPEIARTLATGRAPLSERLAVVAADNADAARILATYLDGQQQGVTVGHAVPSTPPELVFMFTGQGSQYVGMGRQLYDTEFVFRSAMDECAALVDPYLDRALLDVIWGEGESATLIDDTAFTQPALFAIEYSLAQLWRSWGVEPTAVVGHSVGEYVAATLAGVFSLSDGLKLIAARGRLMSALPRDGTMVAVFADEQAVQEAIDGLEEFVSIAAVNGPVNTVVSGTIDAIEIALSRLASRQIEFQRLKVSHAFHSPLMNPILDEFEKIAASVTFKPRRIGLISNVTGTHAGADITRPSYWRRQVREAVRFGDAIEALLDDGYRMFLEVGPGSTLVGMARRGSASAGAVWASSLRKGRDDRASMLEGLGQLYVNGQRVTWSAVFGRIPAAKPFDLPTYPFQRRRFWIEGQVGGQGTRLRPLRSGHPLLGGGIDSPLHIFQSEVGIATHPWLGDHRFFDIAPFPATGFLELALAAVREVHGSADGVLREAVIHEGLVLPESGTVTLQVTVTPEGDATSEVQVFSRAVNRDGVGASGWRRHVSATYSTVADTSADILTAPALPAAVPFDVASYYAKLTKQGVSYGPSFLGIRAVNCARAEVLGEVELPGAIVRQAQTYLMHPALLDAALQLVGVMLPGAGDPDAPGGDLYMPTGVERYSVRAAGTSAARCHAKLDNFEEGSGAIRADITLFDESGQLVAELKGLSFLRVNRALLMRAINGAGMALARENWLYELAWRILPPTPKTLPPPAGHWIILADQAGSATQLAARLTENGATVTLIYQRAAVNGPSDEWVVDSTDAADVMRAIGKAAAHGLQSVAGIVLLWPLDDAGKQTIAEIEVAQRRLVEGALNVVRTLSSAPSRLWIVTRGAQPAGGCVPDLVQSPLLGVGNVIAGELPDLRCVRIDLDPSMRPGEPDLLFDTIWHADAEDRIVFRDNVRQVARLVPGTLSLPSDEPRTLEITSRGQLDNLQLRAASRRKPGPGNIELRIHATGLNFRDVLNALGMYPGDPGPLGNECAGVVTAVGEGVEHLAVGDDVVSMVDRSFATYVIAPAALTVRKPPQLSFVEAATVPVAFLTAAYALRDLGRIRKGDRVLIHAVTGGVGMAALQIAKHAGAEIIGTAGSPVKRELARALGVHHIADSRSLSFEGEVRRVTGGEGVDIVLNSLAGDFIPASLRVLKPGGRFIEIGKKDILSANDVARQFPDVEYHALYLGEVAAARPDFVRGMLETILSQIAANELQPIPQRVYPIERAQDAFRFMAQGHHTGKIVITQRQPIIISERATYLITGGLGGLGLACARWLADSGARHVVLIGRRSPDGAARAAIAELEAQGVEVRLAPVDVTDAVRLEELLESVTQTMPPLRGVLHAAGSVDDGMLSDQNWTRFERVMAPKVRGTWNLSTLTRHLPLDFFVMFSSGAALLGSPGQGNYAAANSFLDSLAYVRLAAGLPALSIDWGIWSEVGMAARVDQQHHRRWAAMGMKPIDPSLGVQMLEQAVRGSSAGQVAALPIDRSRLPAGVSAFYSELVTGTRGDGNGSDDATDVDILGEISPLSGTDRVAVLVRFISDQVIRVLALSPSHKIDPERSLMDMGMDSLMAMELRNRLKGKLGTTLDIKDLLGGASLRDLAIGVGGLIEQSPSSRNSAPGAGTPAESKSNSMAPT